MKYISQDSPLYNKPFTRFEFPILVTYSYTAKKEDNVLETGTRKMRTANVTVAKDIIERWNTQPDAYHPEIKWFYVLISAERE